MRRTRLIPALVLAAALLAPSDALGETFTPTTAADGSNGACTPALCTLRDAVVASNINPPGPDEIVLGAGTYELTLGELLLTSPATISGAGARQTTIDANGTDRAFEAETTGTVTFQDLTITGGAAGPTSSAPAGDGGAILNQSDEVVLRRVALVGNTANFSGGAYAAPFESLGGGAQVTTMEDSLVAGNSVAGGALNGQGGGMSLFGDATITNSTISGNTVSVTLASGEGGGIVSATALADPTPVTLTLLNTTIAGNAINVGGSVGLGGGLVGEAFTSPQVLTNLRAQNTIIAGNTVGGNPSDCAYVGTTSTSHNLSGDASCGFTDPGSKRAADPLLSPLANNGGPTDTRSFPTGSPAFNAGDNTGCPGSDQRGTVRPQALICDIGAYEARAAIRVTQGAKRTVRAGRKLIYSLKIRNRGEVTLSNVRLTDRLPVRVRGLKKGKRAKCKFPKQRRKAGGKRHKRLLKCRFASLAPGASRKLKIKVRPMKSKRLRNTARVTSDGGLRDFAKTVVRVKRAP